MRISGESVEREGGSCERVAGGAKSSREEGRSREVEREEGRKRWRD